jgi:hypothetical protein
MNSTAAEPDLELTRDVLRGRVDYQHLDTQQQQSVERVHEWLTGEACGGCADLCLRASNEVMQVQQFLQQLLERLQVCDNAGDLAGYQQCLGLMDAEQLQCLQGLRELPMPETLEAHCRQPISDLPFQRENLITSIKNRLYRCE